MPPTTIDPFQTVSDRQRLLVVIGLTSVVIGLITAGWVGYEWFVFTTSHVVMALVSGVLVVLGIQLLVFSFMASMIIELHRDLQSSLDDE